MCTLTWTHRVEASGRSYRLWFNRDELRSRGPEVPPREEVTDGGVRYIAPADSDAGGTWLAVNEFGVTVALLNGYRDSKGPPRETWTSRGHLVRELAGVRDAHDVWPMLSPRALAPYRPAVVVVVTPHAPTLLARWDGLDVSVDTRAERQLPVTSSSYEQDAVQRFRRELYRGMVGENATLPDPEVLRAFQRHVEPDGPTAFTPSMARPDASTRSQCFIDVGPDSIALSYAPGAPHETRYDPPVTLPRAG